MRALAAALVAIVPVSVAAQSRPANLTLLPSAPVAGELVRLRHDIAPCVEEAVFVEALGRGALRVTLAAGDTCDAALPARSALHELGRFLPGTVEITWVSCEGLPPPPVPACRTLGTDVIVVAGGIAPRAVPVGSASPFVLAGLVWLALRYRRPAPRHRQE